MMKVTDVFLSMPTFDLVRSGRKTQHRVVVADCMNFRDWDSRPDDAYDVITAADGRSAAFLVSGDHGFTDWVDCPLGGPGDRLVVRPRNVDDHVAEFVLVEVVSTRAERLQQLSEEDARAEGMTGQPPIGNLRSALRMGYHRYEFAEAWDASEKGAPWSSDPWVWVLGFKRVE